MKTKLLLSPEKLLQAFDVHEDAIVADFGCGPGFFALPAAQLAAKGTVYCLDVLSEALESVESRAKTLGLFNITVRRVDLEKKNGSELQDASVDRVIARNILWQSEDVNKIFVEAARVLRAGGKLLVVSWQKRDMVIGPPSGKRPDRDTIVQHAEQNGFSLEKELSAGEHHNAFIFAKS